MHVSLQSVKPIQVALVVTYFLRKHNIAVLPRTALSPDLFPQNMSEMRWVEANDRTRNSR